MLAKNLIVSKITGRELKAPRSSEPLPTRAEIHRQRNQADRHWFVLLTEPNMERRAAAFLTARRFKNYLPEMLRPSTRGLRRKKVLIRRPIFPGYVFLFFGFAIDGDRRHFVERAPGVHKFLKFDDGYATLSGDLMERLFGIEQELLKPKKVQGPSSIFSPGEDVRISSGPFCGLNASIETLDDDERVTALLSLLGRAVRTQFFAEQLEKL